MRTRLPLTFLLVASTLLPAAELSLDRLFSRPFLWGTWPSQLAWAKDSHVLGFLWNAHGDSFKDLYTYNSETKKLLRLTDLEDLKDPINDSEAEHDIHRKEYLPPPTGLTSFDFSRDGSKAVFSYRGDLFMVSTSGGAPQRLTKTKAAEVNPQFSPGANKIAFTQSGQLYVMSLDGGLLEQRTEVKPPANLTSYKWSPDGKYLSYSVQSAPGRSMPLPIYSGQFVTASAFPRSVAGDSTTGWHWYVVESSGDSPARELELGKGNASRPAQWSPDSKSLLLISQSADFKSEDIRIADVATLKSKVVFHQTDDRWVETSDAGWDQQSKHIWFITDQTGYQQLYIVDPDGGNEKQVTKGLWDIHNDPFSHSPQWIGDYIYYSSTQQSTAERQFYKVRAEGSSHPDRLSTRAGMNVGWMSEDGTQQALLEADPKEPFDLYVNGERITKSPLPEFYKLPWADTHYFTYPSLKDHKQVSARLLLPPGYKPEDPSRTKRPAIVYIHGSGYATSVLKQWGSYQEQRFAFNNYLVSKGYVVLEMDYRGSTDYGRDWRTGVYLNNGSGYATSVLKQWGSYQEQRFAFNNYLVSKGYVVLEMDYRGSTDYGRDWRTGVYLNMSGPDLEDVLGGVEYLRGLKNIDMGRIGIWGWSYGGFMTAAAMFKAPEVFKAGAAFSGVYDWANYNAGYTDERLTAPYQNPEAFRRSSPITFSSQLQNHLLILHGMADTNVLFQEAVQLSEKLIHEGKTFEEAFYPEENHAYVRDESYRDAFNRAVEFFDRNLK